MKMLDGVFDKALENLEKARKITNQQKQRAIAFYTGSRLFNFLECFSKESNILSQWRNYADDARGFVIGFNEDLFCADSDYKLFRDEINPDKDVKHFFLHDVIYLEQNELSNLVNQAEKWILQPQSNNFFEHIFLGKHASFREEKEVRLLWLPELIEKVETVIDEREKHNIFSKVHFRTERDKIIPYVEFPFSKESVKEIIIGPKNKMNPDTIALKIFLCNEGYDDKTIAITKFDSPYT